MPRLLIVHHTTSPSTALDVRGGARRRDRSARSPGVEVVARAALAATALDVLEADGYLLGTPANLGYMSGALKHFFDQIYYPCLDATSAARSASTCTATTTPTGAIAGDRDDHHRPAVAAGAGAGGGRSATPSADDLDACRELGAALAAGLMLET